MLPTLVLDGNDPHDQIHNATPQYQTEMSWQIKIMNTVSLKRLSDMFYKVLLEFHFVWYLTQGIIPQVLAHFIFFRGLRVNTKPPSHKIHYTILKISSQVLDFSSLALAILILLNFNVELIFYSSDDLLFFPQDLTSFSTCAVTKTEWKDDYCY